MIDKNFAVFWTILIAFSIDAFIVYKIEAFLTIISGFGENLIFSIIVSWIYFSIMISRWGFTIGGKLLGIDILADDGKHLTFLKASIRLIVSLLPFILYRNIRGWQYSMSPSLSPDIQMLPQLLFMLYPLSMFFTQKRQMIHDLIAKSVVIDHTKGVKNDSNTEEETISNGGKINNIRKILRTLGVVGFLVVLWTVLPTTFVFYKLAKEKQASYDASFHQHYQLSDHNDSRIRFYQKELEKYSKDFVEAEGLYDIFAADTKRDLALNCIEATLKDHNVSNWIDEGSKFRKNARNKFATTKKAINRAKINEDWMGKYFYYYDLNDVNHIEDKIGGPWDSKINEKTCNTLMPVEKMYDLFMQQYIPNREDALHRDEEEYKHANSTGTLDKSFYKKEIEKTEQWLKILRQHVGHTK
jgi:uncharacterized RDD family membrane protein YckC